MHGNWLTTKSANKKASGFTLIETMVAVSIFAIIVTVGIASLLALNASYKLARRDRALVDGVAGAIERMTREIKTGYQYTCNPLPTNFNDIVPASPDGTCDTFGFYATESGSTVRTIYALDNGMITVFLDDGVQTDPIPVTPAEVSIDTLSFTLAGNAPGNDQPYVIIRINGTVSHNGEQNTFSLQTTVDQRFPDTSA